MGALELKSITKSFGATEVIKGVDLTVNDGEFCVFVGPSGCGKSTLLRIIAGLEDASTGDILVDGRRMNDVAPAKRELAMVFQSYALYPHLNVRDNMGLALKQAGVPKPQIAQATDRAHRMGQSRPAPQGMSSTDSGLPASARARRARLISRHELMRRLQLPR